jgi:hypothetical protein
MTSRQAIESVTLNGPEDWATWDTQFKAKAVTSELWDLINLIAQEEVLFATKPVALGGTIRQESRTKRYPCTNIGRVDLKGQLQSRDNYHC